MATRSRTRKASTAQPSVAPPIVQQAKPETRARKKITNADAEKENEATKTMKGASKAKGRKIGKAQSKEVNCTCSSGDDGSPMVRCAVCLIWYHFTCVDLSEPEAEDISAFICPACTESTGRRTVMNWEGPSAFEDSPDGAPTEPPQPPSKRAKYLPQPKEPKYETDEEEGEDPSSDDEYVVDQPQPKGRLKQHPSLSLDSESDTDENDRPRRRRIHKMSISPEPSGQANLKRKNTSTGATQPPAPKKKKATSVIATDDPTRKYCLGKLEEIFRDVFLRYPHVPVPNLADGEQADIKLIEKQPEDLTEEENAQVLERANRFATVLEQCVYEIYCEPDKQGEPHAGGKYKDRFRMLQFNLSKPDRVVLHKRVSSGGITPKEISVMSSTDLADEETKQHIKIAEQEALEHSILQKSTVPRAKITHKGLQDIEDINGELVSLREREREREREQEEEERRERERMARVRAAQTQQRQRTASMSVPPESPTVPQQIPTMWGAPPPVPAHAIGSPREETLSPTSTRPPPSPLFVHTTSELTTSEPELNLADIINIEDEAGHDTTAVAEPLVDSPSPMVPEDQVPVDAAEQPQEVAQSPPSSTAVTTGISPFAAKPAASSFDLSSLWSGPSAAPASASPATLPSPKSPTPVTEEPKDVNVEPVTVHGAEDQDFDMFLEEKEDKEQPSPPVPPRPEFEDRPQVWSGKISMPLESTMQETAVVARQLGGRPIDDTSLLWKTLFPTETLRIDGRVPTQNSCSFLLQTRLNPSKELIAVVFSPADSGNVQSFEAISDFLIGKNRHGLIFPWGQRPKEYCPGRELYIVPLQATDPLPECIELLDSLKLPKERNNNYLIGVWILYKGRLAPPQLPPLSQPVQAPPLPPLTANITSTIFGHPPSAPPTSSGLDTNALAKEVATLTPEQIQNVLRTLAVTSQIPLPPQAPQVPHPQPQAPGQPTALHSMSPMPMLAQQPQPWGAHPPAPYPAPYHAPMQLQPPPPPPGPPPPFELQEQRDYRRDVRPPGSAGQGHDRIDRGRGRGARGRGRGRDGESSPRRPVDSGWPQRKAWGDAKGGPPSPTRRW